MARRRPVLADRATDLIDEDPRDTLARLIASEDRRLSDRQRELATARNALVRLHDLGAVPAASAITPLTVEVAPTLLRNLLDESPGPLRNALVRLDVGSGTEQEWLAYNMDAVRDGLEQRTLYDDSVLDSADGVAFIAEWGAIGERQRVAAGVPSEFLVYDDSAVVGPAVWGDATSDYVVIRDPMVVRVFIDLFDRLWDAASPLPSARGVDVNEDAALLDLLARGFKDEAIARYLGWSLRTVRRRVARLMEELGTRTRFQLGAEAVRAGRLDTHTSR